MHEETVDMGGEVIYPSQMMQGYTAVYYGASSMDAGLSAVTRTAFMNGFNVLDEMIAANRDNGGSIYADVSARNPAPEIGVIQSRLEELFDLAVSMEGNDRAASGVNAASGAIQTMLVETVGRFEDSETRLMEHDGLVRGPLPEMDVVHVTEAMRDRMDDVKREILEIRARIETATSSLSMRIAALPQFLGRTLEDGMMKADVDAMAEQAFARLDGIVPDGMLESVVVPVLPDIAAEEVPLVDVVEVITLADTALAEYTSNLDQLSPFMDIGMAHELAVSMTESRLLDETNVDEAVDSFETRTVARHQRAVSRVATGMFDAGTVMTTQFGIALALLENDRAIEVNDYEVKLRLQNDQLRVEHVAQLVSSMTRMKELEWNMRQYALGMRIDIEKTLLALGTETARVNTAISQLNLDLARLSSQFGIDRARLALDVDARNMDKARLMIENAKIGIDTELNVFQTRMNVSKDGLDRANSTDGLTLDWAKYELLKMDAESKDDQETAGRNTQLLIAVEQEMRGLYALKSELDRAVAMYDMDSRRTRLDSDKTAVGLSIEVERLKSVVEQQGTDRRVQSVMTVFLEIMRMHANQGPLFAQAAAMQGEFNKMALGLYQAQTEFDMQMELRDAMWNLDLFNYGHQALGAIQGVNSKIGMSDFERDAAIWSIVLGAVAQAIPLLA